MKTAVVYYSCDGNCAFMAEQIKGQLNADLIRLETADEKKRGGFAKYFFGGFQAMTGKKPALKPYNFDPAAYDMIILGTPVWAGSPAPAMRSFLSQTKISGKKLALFICYGGGKGKVMDKLRALVQGNTIVSEADFIEPARNNPEEQKKRITDWAKTITA